MSLSAARTVDEAVRAATQVLGPRTDGARFDAEVLMAHALGVSRSELFLHRMGDAPPARFAQLIARRAAQEPVAHIVGSAGFWALDFVVTPAVLIPRGDSETLIEAAVQAFAGTAPGRILDLGTGSGCLLLSALHEWPEAEAVGIDRSAEALAVAGENARRHPGKNGPAQLLQRDWSQPGWAGELGEFDLVLANPPYVEDAALLEPSVRDHEPGGALFAGPEGLDDYRLLVPQLPALLSPGGIALVEIGASQADAVSAIAAAAGFEAALHLDLADRPRALELKIPLGKPRDSA